MRPQLVQTSRRTVAGFHVMSTVAGFHVMSTVAGFHVMSTVAGFHVMSTVALHEQQGGILGAHINSMYSGSFETL